MDAPQLPEGVKDIDAMRYMFNVLIGVFSGYIGKSLGIYWFLYNKVESWKEKFDKLKEELMRKQEAELEKAKEEMRRKDEEILRFKIEVETMRSMTKK